MIQSRVSAIKSAFEQPGLAWSSVKYMRQYPNKWEFEDIGCSSDLQQF